MGSRDLSKLEVVRRVPRLAPRARDSHKGDFGNVLVVAGSRGMAGAAGLVGASALRSGAGLVRIATAQEVQATVASYEPSYMTWPLAQDDEGCIALPAATTELTRLIKWATVLAVGPGIGSGEARSTLIKWLLETFDGPVVLDADGLNALAGDCGPIRGRKGVTVLTPHPGELGRLLRAGTTEIKADRTGHTLRLVEAAGPEAIVVLKGSETTVTDGTRLFVNTSGNPGMATGGSGDCLTGAIAALLGQKLEPLDAAILGVHAHGIAGDMAARKSGEVGMIASDLVEHLAAALHHLTDIE